MPQAWPKRKKNFFCKGLETWRQERAWNTQRQRKNISQSRSWWIQGWIGVVVQLLSHVQLLATPRTAAHQAPLSFTISQSLVKIMSIESVILFDYLIFCHPLLLLPSISPSIRVFSNELVLRIRWPKYWSLYFSISPSNEYSGLIYFRMDWFDLLVVKRTLKSLLQHRSSKASIFGALHYLQSSSQYHI